MLIQKKIELDFVTFAAPKHNQKMQAKNKFKYF